MQERRRAGVREAGQRPAPRHEGPVYRCGVGTEGIPSVKLMSFSLTTRQMRARAKTVTRRVGWLKLRPGAELLAVEKAMGLKKGEKVVPIGRIRVLDVRRERLDELVRDDHYGFKETAK